MSKDSGGYRVARAEVSDEEAAFWVNEVLDALPAADDIGHKLGVLATTAAVLIEQSAQMLVIDGALGDDAARIANELFGEFIACVLKGREAVWEDDEVIHPVTPERA